MDIYELLRFEDDVDPDCVADRSMMVPITHTNANGIARRPCAGDWLSGIGFVDGEEK